MDSREITIIRRFNTDQINYINIGLMILSGVLAIAYPFALFLFSYAVLGPLHYLTEISWLHDRKYFMRGERDYLWLAGFGLLIILGPMLIPDVLIWSILTFVAFVAAAFFSTTNPVLRIGLVFTGFLFLPNFFVFRFLVILFGLLLPTIIHVFVFTGMFILAGALKSRRLSGMLSLIVFVAVSILVLVLHPQQHGMAEMPSHYVRSSYGEISAKGMFEGFISLNYYLASMLGFGPAGSASSLVDSANSYLYGDPVARAIMAFIAFAYTYHYLNWFSKTSVIGWHQISARRLYVILFVWVASLILYAASYQVGVRWLLLLSFLHVVLEFPLNHITFVGIAQGLSGRVKKPA